MHHFGEKTKINLDLGRFCIIFVFGFESVLVEWRILGIEMSFVSIVGGTDRYKNMCGIRRWGGEAGRSGSGRRIAVRRSRIEACGLGMCSGREGATSGAPWG